MIKLAHRNANYAQTLIQIASIVIIVNIEIIIVQINFILMDNATDAKEDILGIIIIKNVPNVNIINIWILK